MLVVRPAGPADFSALMELAILSGPGFTSLPEHEPTLRERLEVSKASFEGRLPREQRWYTIMLEDLETHEVIGVAGVKAAVGMKRPFFSFRIMTFAQSSPTLDMRFDHRALVLVNECTGWSEVGSLFLKAERRKGGAGQLLALSRYLLIAADPEQFSENVLAELRGVFDDDGGSPFWDCVTSKFFRMPFNKADEMSASTNGQFILDLAPRHPIYVDLLPKRARDVVGEVHKDGEAARALLAREGFRPTGLIDIFDAGPTVSCPRDDIRTVRDSVRATVEVVDAVDGPMTLVATAQIGRFRAVRVPAAQDGERVRLTPEAADALGVSDGETVRLRKV
jgi:arginine N-succinyltransferase